MNLSIKIILLPLIFSLLFSTHKIIGFEEACSRGKISGEEKSTKNKKPLFSVKEHLRPHDLNGISEEQIRQHWQLYEGYVKQSNQLHEEIQKHIKEGTSGSPDCSDRRRRYGFEYNGMVLHEYYFGNIKSGKNEPLQEGKLLEAIKKQFGSFKKWQEDFINAGKTRGIGWAIMTLDPKNGLLTNIFVDDHEIGHIAGFCPILVMDVWEHAYMVDYEATQRGNYIDAFTRNINWKAVNDRYENAIKHKMLKKM